MGSAKPRIHVREGTPADVPILTKIHFDAFAPDPAGQILNPKGLSEDAKLKFGIGLFPPDTPGVKSSEESLVTVAELLPEDGPDDGPGEIIAYGKWSIYREARPKEEWDVDLVFTADMVGEGGDPEAYQFFIGGLAKLTKSFTRGDPHMCK